MNISILSALVCLSVGTITQPISIENISSHSEFLVVLDTEESLKWKDYSSNDFEFDSEEEYFMCPHVVPVIELDF